MKHKIKIRNSKHSSPFKNLLTELRTQQKVEEDYFAERSMCPIGAINPIQYYENGEIPHDHLIYTDINPAEHLNLCVIGASGSGKTRVIKNAILWYTKQGYKVLVFSPKTDEWTSATHKGTGKRLHCKMRNEKLKVVSYCPSYVRHYMERNEFDLSKYKFYSHKIDSFTAREVWESLGLSPTASSHVVGLVNQGTSKLKQLQDRVKKSNLVPMSKSACIEKLETMMTTKFINDRIKDLDLEHEWLMNDVIAINYFSQKGFLMSTDLWLLVNKVREYCQKKHRKKQTQQVIILFDDANYYADNKPYNNYSISAITDCQVNFRAIGINCVVACQFPEVVDGDVIKGSTSKLISFVEDPNSLRGVLPEDAVYVLKATAENNGLIIDKSTYTTEWIMRLQGREWFRLFPFDCMVGHD